MERKFDKKRFAKNLKKLIKLNNVKHIDLAEYLEVKKSAVSNYISGKYNVKIETAVRIASFFDVDIDYLIGNTKTTLKEDVIPTFNIPVFQKTLVSDTVIYKSPNYIGVMSSPIPISADGDCYAVKIYDDSMKSFGFFPGSLAFFTPEGKVESGDIAAVLIKSKKQIVIRSVKLDKRKITLISDEKTEEFKVTRSDCDAQILGKIVYATFNPNEKATD